MTSDSSSESDNEHPVNVPTNHVVKKRGRPPKKNLQFNQKQPINKSLEKKKNNNDEEIILHLKLFDDNNDSSSERNVFTMRDESDKKQPVITRSKSVSETSDESSDNNLSSSDTSINKNYFMTEIKKRDNLIKRLKSALQEVKTTTSYDTNVYTTKDSKFKPINLKLISIKDGSTIVVEKTDIACWWCTEQFESMPCFIPDRLINDKYYVFGCFCTYSCAKAYNADMGDYRVASRTSLLNKLYKIFYNTTIDLQMAPPREMLQKFGGPKTLEEFRNQSLLAKKEYKITIPPMIHMSSTYDEINKEYYEKGSKTKK